MKNWQIALGCLVPFALCLVLASEAAKISASGSGQGATIYVSNIASDLIGLIILLTAAVAIWGLVLMARRKWNGAILVPYGIACGIYSLSQVLTVFDCYSDLGKPILKDGREYGVVAGSGFGDNEISIGRITHRTFLGTSYEVVAYGPGSWNSMALKLSTPLPGNDTMVQTEDGILVYVTENEVYLAYDPRKGVAYGQTDTNNGELATWETPVTKLLGKKLMGRDVTLLNVKR